MLSLLQGNMASDYIRLKRGTLDLHFPEQAGGQQGLPVHGLRLDQVDVNWQFGDWQGKLAKLQLQLDQEARRLNADTETLHLNVYLDKDGLPDSFHLHCDHTDWLPESMRHKLDGAPTADISLKRRSSRTWELRASAQAQQAFTLMPNTIYSLPLNALSTQITIKTQPDQALTPKLIQISHLTWNLGKDSVSLHGAWENQQLSLQISSDHLPMPLIWSRLRPVGHEPWHQWLARMKHGAAESVKGQLSTPWADPLHTLPFQQGHEGLKYSFHASVADADIALGTGPDTLTQLNAEVDIDQIGLTARINDTVLPHQLGHSSGKIYIPWSSRELQIQGHAQIDAEQLVAWQGPSSAHDWQWRESASDASFTILWRIDEAKPQKAEAHIQPINQWDVTIQQVPLQLTAGMIDWTQESGIHIKQMQIIGERMQGTLSLTASLDEQGQWQLASMDAQGQGDLATIAAHFKLPISHAGGMLSTAISYDGHWSGKLDLTHSRWDHLLGSSKKIGESFAISYQGDFDKKSVEPAIQLTQLQSMGKALQASGNAYLNHEGLILNFTRLKTKAFDGEMNINAPFGNTPWEINVQADYLNRSALPDALEHLESSEDKHWKLNARIKQFDWADAHMSGVNIKLASKIGSTGIIEASQIHTAQLDILDVNGMFTLLGKGEIDLRHLNASVEKQHLNLSARLSPEAGGGLQWRGFATIAGDFGYLMQRGKLSEKFQSGQGHVLFSGHGIMLREQPWWKGMDGRLRLRVDDGRVLEGGTLTTFLSAISLADLPKLLFGQRKDLSGPGIMYKRLQMEALMKDENISIRNLAMRSTAFDMAGHGSMDIRKDTIDLYLIARPLQNLDAILAKIPLLRDLLGGKAHSFMRKVYHMHGPFTHAEVDAVDPKEAGLASAGLVERLFALPESWFGKNSAQPAKASP